jgi:hypothetical protein
MFILDKFLKYISSFSIYTFRHRSFAVVLLFFVVLTSCNPVKYVPNDKYLLDRNEIVRDEKGENIKNLNGFYRQIPNKRMLGFRFHLWLYNRAKPGSERWFSRKARLMGEEPVLFDSLMMKKTKEQLSLYLSSKGYYNATVTDSVVYSRKRAKVWYSIKMNQPYRVRNISYQFEGKHVVNYVLPDTLNSLIIKGKNFDMDILQAERLRIETNLKNNGFFNFSKEYIYFQADTFLNTHQVDLQLIIKNYILDQSTDTLVYGDHRQYSINSVKVILDHDIALSSDDDGQWRTRTFDSLQFDIKGKAKPYIRASTVAGSVFIRPLHMYKMNDVDETYKHISSLRFFKFVNIGFKELNPRDTAPGALDATIRLYPSVLQSHQEELEGTNSAGNLGAALTFSYQHRNLFRGAEIFDVKLRGAFETMKSLSQSDFHNTLELGAESNLLIPKFLLPFKSVSFVQKYNPKTNISLGYNYQRRPLYVKTVANITFGYSWKGQRNTSYVVNPVELNWVQLPYMSPNFADSINKTVLRYSYYDHLLSASSFTFVFNNQKLKTNTSVVYLRNTIEVAGNTFRLLSNYTGADTINTHRKLFGNEFFQYLKSDIEFKYYHPLNVTDKLVTRFFIGVGLPYTNSLSMPFEKMYFSGGSTLRAWQIRSLGPGSYYLPTKPDIYEQIADMKLEANLEYRFKLFWVLEGALFGDIGNIWDITQKEHEEGFFRFNRFYKQFAIGSGLGLRFDFNFFLARLDLGLKLRDPSIPSGSHWVPIRTGVKDMNLTFGIGYPF